MSQNLHDYPTKVHFDVKLNVTWGKSCLGMPLLWLTIDQW